MITLSDGITTVTLPDGLHWQDEHNWQPVGASSTRGLTGKLIIQTAQATKGRPITLVPFSENAAWWSRENLASLNAWLSVPDKELVFNFLGDTFDVRFRHYDAPAVEAVPVMFYSDPTNNDYIQPTIKLVTV